MEIVHAMVIKGSGRGKDLGFPTLNLMPESPDGGALPLETLKIQEGIYAARVTIEGEIFPAVLYFGRREMFGEPALSLEAHLLDYMQYEHDEPSVHDNRSRNDEGAKVTVEIGAFIRPPQIFKNAEELKDAIANDIRAAKEGTNLQ